MSKNCGFSLIELMIVVVIVGILSMIAIPSYQSYTQRARFTEIISATEIFKTAIALALQQGIPANEINHGMHGIPEEPQPTKNLASLNVNNSIITAMATTILNNATMVLTPNQNGSIWNVGGTCIEAGLCQ